jgi:filamentous hemagglutinin family protein
MREFKENDATRNGNNLLYELENQLLEKDGITFTHGLEIQNIIVHIMNELDSEIDGPIQDSGTANIFLVQPHGKIFFGSKTLLDSQGSFLISTANFPENGLSVPLQFFENLDLDKIDGSIYLEGAELSVRASKTLSLASNKIVLNNAKLITTGDLEVYTSDAVELSGESYIFTPIHQEDEGHAGSLKIKTGRLTIQDGAQIGTATEGRGNAGNLDITAKEIQLSGTRQLEDGTSCPSALLTQAEPGSTGDSGGLILKADQLIIQDGAQISTSTKGSGKAGDLKITATHVELSGTHTAGEFPGGIFAHSESAGNAGHITLDIKTLNIHRGAQVSASAFGSGSAGSIKVCNPDAEVRLIGMCEKGGFPSGLFARNGIQEDLIVKENVWVETRNLIIQEGAKISPLTANLKQDG